MLITALTPFLPKARFTAVWLDRCAPALETTHA